ncbi:hypothetical protein D3C81_938030 [compost metagenome]
MLIIVQNKVVDIIHKGDNYLHLLLLVKWRRFHTEQHTVSEPDDVRFVGQRHHHELRRAGIPAKYTPYRYRKPRQLLLPVPLGVELIQNDFRYLIGQTLIEILLALEVPVQRGSLNPQPVGQSPHAEFLDPLLSKKRPRSFQNLILRNLRLLFFHHDPSFYLTV